ncbi:MAG: hypothetical protein FJ265_09615 [Planctomycetes bacterium]|nr:hypothetical protein [Planctomycetota bacterium]
MWPSLWLVSDEGRTCAAWWDERTARAHSLVRYLDSGTAWLDREQAAAECAALIQSVLARLEDQGLETGGLREQWHAVLGADGEERRFCEAAAELGLDPYAATEASAAAIVTANEAVPPGLFHELAAEADIERLTAESLWCQRAAAAAATLQGLPAWSRLRGSLQLGVPVDGGPPWRVGYSRAEQVRQLLKLGVGPLPADVLGELASPETVVPSTTGRIALGFAREDAAGIVFGAMAGRVPAGTSKTFLRARAMHELLHGQGPAFLLTRANTREQATGRAFAAEMLVPAAAIRARIRDRVATGDDVVDIAAEFAVAEQVVRLQIVNHGIPASLE